MTGTPSRPSFCMNGFSTFRCPSIGGRMYTTTLEGMVLTIRILECGILPLLGNLSHPASNVRDDLPGSHHRNRDHEIGGVPVTDVPRQVSPAGRILQEDKVAWQKPPHRPIGRLHLHRSGHEGQELPGGGRVPVTDPAGLKRIKAIVRCDSIRGHIERGSGWCCTHQALFDRHGINVGAPLCI